MEPGHGNAPVITSLSRRPWDDWSVERVAKELKLEEHDIPDDIVQKFEEESINGKKLNGITRNYITTTLKTDPEKIVKFLKDLEERDKLNPAGSKVFNDPVHGHLELHPLFVAIIDTPQFQRLRYLKQLGAGYFVYPGASHNRFEHSLGVCYLAGRLVEALRKRQPELGITNQDMLCVQIAGLCHDLGHGPFSHLFDRKFIPSVKPESEWQHEDASIDMFNHMVSVNKLERKFERYWLTKEHRTFIKEQIIGKPLTETAHGKVMYYKKESKKAFLYEIVANKRNGVDVDKWDYFKRDCHHLGMSSSFDHVRFIQFSRVIDVKGDMQICVRDKEAHNMYEMFLTRQILHRRAYQHRVVQVVEIMLAEAMKKADDYITIPGDNGKRCKPSECIEEENMDAFTNLTDSIFHQILLDPRDDAPLKGAQRILQDIQRRKLYKCVGESEPITDDKINKKTEEVKTEILDLMRSQSKYEVKLDSSRVTVQFVKLDFGKEDENPVDSILFFTKESTEKAKSVPASQVSSMLPQVVFREWTVRLFLRLTEDKDADGQLLQNLYKGFKGWCKKHCFEKTKKLFEADSPETDD